MDNLPQIPSSPGQLYGQTPASSTTKTHNSSLIKVFLAGLIAFILGGGAVYGYFSFKNTLPVEVNTAPAEISSEKPGLLAALPIKHDDRAVRLAALSYTVDTKIEEIERGEPTAITTSLNKGYKIPSFKLNPDTPMFISSNNSTASAKLTDFQVGQDIQLSLQLRLKINKWEVKRITIIRDKFPVASRSAALNTEN